MNRLRASLLSLVLLPCLSYGWSAPGHQAIAVAGVNMLPADTKAKVMAILGKEKIEDAAIWLDLVREDRLKGLDFAEVSQFRKNFPDNGDWHFSDFPLGATQYRLTGPFSSPNDVVHALENAISALEGKPSKLTKLQALRAVLHLTGDIHQPLHCETGFYDLSDMQHPKLLKTTSTPATTPSDRGGNQLFYTKSEELHALWDKSLPDSIAKNPATLATKITVPDFKTQFVTKGDYHRWPESWATDSMQAAAQAAKGIMYNSAAYVPDARHPGKQKLQIMITLPGGTPQYKADQKALAQTQLTKGAVHLAQLLNSIKFE